ncbi:MAG TPA: hypothetical protein VLE22_05910 [Bryobacteraceae bacterium]|nr:hypothetical protein [Bryobacteraceae bacterium]
MTSHLRKTHSIYLGILTILLCNVANAQSTHPKDFVTVKERPPRGQDLTLNPGDSEVDERGKLVIDFTEAKMQPKDEGGRPRVIIRISGELFKEKSSLPLVPIQYYVSKGNEQNPVVVHDKDFLNPGDIMPDTDINLRSIGFGDYEYLELRITNLVTLESVVYTVSPQPFGFRVKVTDSLLFLKRLGVSEEDKKNGVDAINFGPSPGVTYGGTYLSRGNDFLRFMRPGAGMNVSFMNWKDPAFDLSTGKFAPATKGSDVQVGLGVQFSLFNNILQFTYGANLHVEQDRQYWGIGISFVNLTSKVASLIQ